VLGTRAPMRLLRPVMMIAVVVLSSLAPPPARGADGGVSLDGHWRCAGTGIPATERSFFTFVPRPPVKRTAREIFASADRTERDGRPSTSFEHMIELPDQSLQVEAVEGNGMTAPHASFPLRFTGRSFDDAAPFTLTYDLAGTSLHRVATRGDTVIDEERCTREPEPAATACPQPNVPATVVHAAEPQYPAAAYAKRAKGVVQVRVVLDDRSRVLWADVEHSDEPMFNDSARGAARDTTYRTAIQNCRPIPSVYIFTVDYSP